MVMVMHADGITLYCTWNTQDFDYAADEEANQAWAAPTAGVC